MKTKILFALTILFLIVFSTSTIAKDNSAHGFDTEPSDSPHPESRRSPEPSESPEIHDKGNDVIIRSCQAREAAIDKRTSQLVNLVANIEGKFDAIAVRVEDFYTNKVLPKGKTVPNYSTLTGDIATQKLNVANALALAQTDMNNFSCTTGNPKDLLNKFRMDMQTVKEALKDYRTSIRNLIVAIHTILGNENESPSPSASPSSPLPSVSPTASPSASPVQTPTSTPTATP